MHLSSTGPHCTRLARSLERALASVQPAGNWEACSATVILTPGFFCKPEKEDDWIAEIVTAFRDVRVVLAPALKWDPDSWDLDDRYDDGKRGGDFFRAREDSICYDELLIALGKMRDLDCPNKRVLNFLDDIKIFTEHESPDVPNNTSVAAKLGPVDRRKDRLTKFKTRRDYFASGHDDLTSDDFEFIREMQVASARFKEKPSRGIGWRDGDWLLGDWTISK